MCTQWDGLVFTGLSPEIGGGRGPSHGTGTTNLRDLSLDQGGPDVFMFDFTINLKIMINSEYSSKTPWS